MSKGLTGTRQTEAQDLKVVSTVQLTRLGARTVNEDGDQFVYAKAGAAGLNHGLLASSEATVGNHTNISPAADTAIGASAISVTLGATAVVQDQYTEGQLVVNSGPGAGYRYSIKGHYAANASGTLQLFLNEPLIAAVTAAGSRVSLYKNPCKDVVASTTLSKNPGISIVDIPANNFAWLQTKGLCPVLAQGAVTKDFAIVQSGTTAGAVAAQAAVTDDTVGIANEALVNNEYRLATVNVEK